MHESILYFVVRARCRRKESSRSLSHLLMSFLYNYTVQKPSTWYIAACSVHQAYSTFAQHPDHNDLQGNFENLLP